MADRIDHLVWCLERLDAAGKDAAPGSVVGADLPSLLASAEVARDLVARVALLDDTVEEHPAEWRLLETLLDEARRASEDGKPEGEAFRQAADATCNAQAHASGANPAGLSLLARAYHSAGLSVPLALKEAREQQIGTPAPALDAQSGEQATRLADQLSEALDAAGGELFAFYHQFNQILADLPDPKCQALLEHLGDWANPRAAQLLTYWLFDSRTSLARTAAEALSNRAAGQGLDSQTAGRLAWMRSSLARGPLLDAVDSALARYREHHRHWPALNPTGQWSVAYITVPDGAGAQQLLLGEQRRDGACWSLILVKIGFGIRDAYVLASLDLTEEQDLFEQLGCLELYEIPRASVEALLATAVAENHEYQQTPPPGLIDVAIASGLNALTPAPEAGAERMPILDPEGVLDELTAQKRGRLINQSRDWSEHIGGLESWFLDDPIARSSVSESPNEDAARRELRSHLHQRRYWWAELFLRTALVAAANHSSEITRSLTVTADAVAEGREIRRIPIMEQIIDTTLELFGARDDDRRLPDDPEAPGHPEDLGNLMIYPDDYREVLQPLFDRRPGKGAWPAGYYGVHGFLFGVVTHPDLIQPSEWMDTLFGDPEEGGIVFNEQDEMQRVLNALMPVYNTINSYVFARQAAIPKGAEPSPRSADNIRADSPIRQWAEGFCLAADTFGHLLEYIEHNDGTDSEAYQGLEMAQTLLRMLAYPQGIADEITHKRGTTTTPEEVSDNAVEGLPQYLPLIAMLAYRYRGLESTPYGPIGATGFEPTTEPPQPVQSQKVGRNQPCPCGSGKKYKKCCGNPANR
jgi:yecA family protein